MIHNIARHCTKLFNTQSISKSLQYQSISTFINQSNQYSFSTQQQSKTQTSTPKRPKRQQQNDSFSPIDYYRNTIRHVNIRTNGRGKFSSYNLQKIINMSSNQQHAKIMFEAYFNYLGHFTLIPNKVVDTLIIKALQIGNQTQKILQILSHHTYLSYFPHYDTTKKVIKVFANNKDQQSLQKVFRILIRQPLMKINSKIVNILLQLAEAEDCQPTTRQYILKVLLFRRKLIDGINQQDLLTKIAATLQKVEIGPYQGKPKVRNSINQLLSQTPSSTQDAANRLILSSTFGLIEECGSFLAKQEQQIGTQYDRFFDYLVRLYPRSSQQVNYGTVLKQSLAQAKLSIGVSQKLQKLVNGVSE